MDDRPSLEMILWNRIGFPPRASIPHEHEFDRLLIGVVPTGTAM